MTNSLLFTLWAKNKNGGGGSQTGISEDEIVMRTASMFSGAYSNSTVSCVGKGAFCGCVNLTEVNMPNVTSIGQEAFAACGLTQANFPNCETIGVRAFILNRELLVASFPKCSTALSNYQTASASSLDNITLGAFSGCVKLSSAYFPELLAIPTAMFNECQNLRTISFPKCVTIGSYAFNACQLQAAEFPECATIGTQAFFYCGNLYDVSFPKCTTIGISAFYGCWSLASASFPNVAIIHSHAFQVCTRMSTAVFPECLSLEMYAFAYCSNLAEAHFAKCTTIGGGGFYQCSTLATISFPNATTIGNAAFQGCSALTTLSFPKCTSIGWDAFGDCINLMSFYILTSSVPSIAAIFNNTPIQSSVSGVYGSIFVKASLLDSFKSATNWSVYSARMVGLTDEEIAVL